MEFLLKRSVVASLLSRLPPPPLPPPPPIGDAVVGRGGRAEASDGFSAAAVPVPLSVE